MTLDPGIEQRVRDIEDLVKRLLRCLRSFLAAHARLGPAEQPADATPVDVAGAVHVPVDGQDVLEELVRHRLKLDVRLVSCSLQTWHLPSVSVEHDFAC